MRFKSNYEKYSTYANNKKVKFKNGQYETDDKKIIKALESHPTLNKSFFKIVPPKQKTPVNDGVETDDTPPESNE